MYDEIGSRLRIRQIRQERQDLFRSLELYYRIFICGELPEDLAGEDPDA